MQAQARAEHWFLVFALSLALLALVALPACNLIGLGVGEGDEVSEGPTELEKLNSELDAAYTKISLLKAQAGQAIAQA